MPFRRVTPYNPQESVFAKCSAPRHIGNGTPRSPRTSLQRNDSGSTESWSTNPPARKGYMRLKPHSKKMIRILRTVTFDNGRRLETFACYEMAPTGRASTHTCAALCRNPMGSTSVFDNRCSQTTLGRAICQTTVRPMAGSSSFAEEQGESVENARPPRKGMSSSDGRCRRAAAPATAASRV